MRIRHLLSIGILFLNFTLFAKIIAVDTIAKWNSAMMQNIAADEIDSFCVLHEKISHVYKKEDNLLAWITLHKAIGKAFKKNKAPGTALIYLQKSYQNALFRQPNTDEEWKKLAWLYVYAAFIENSIFERFQVAEKLYYKAHDILITRLNLSNFHIARYLLLPLGEIYTKLGDIPAAETMYKKSIQISYDVEEYYFASRALSNLSIVYRAKGELMKSIASCQEGLALDIDDKVALGALNDNLAKSFADNNQIPKAIMYGNMAQKYFETLAKDNFPAAPSWLVANKDMLGEFYTAEKKFDAANASFKEAEAILDTLYDTPFERDYAKHYQIWALSMFAQNDLESALQLLQKSLQSLLPSFKADNLLANPKAEILYAENTFQDVLILKANIFERKFDENEDKKYLIAALACHELIFEVEKLLRQSYYYESSKLFNIVESRDRCGNAVKIALKLAAKTHDIQFKKKAFEFAERSKSTLLLAYFMENDAQQNSAIPDSILQKEIVFQKAIAAAEETLYNLESVTNSAEQQIQFAQEKLFKQKKKYDVWIKDLEEKYPLFYANKYNYSTICVDEVHDKLIGENEIIIEYFVSENEIYLFVFSKITFDIIEIKKTANFEQNIIDFHQSIEAYQYKGANRDSLCEVYTTLARQLYVQLLQPIEYLGDSKNVKIIPSGILAFLPFDALLTAQPQTLCEFSTYPYALHQFTISYDYSLTLHERMQNIAPRLSANYVGLAPSFSKNGTFSSLQFNVSLIEKITELWENGQAINKEATIQYFQKIVDEFSIIHLATHAEANMDAGNYSFIVFANENGGYDSLFVRDIYELRLLTEMVVLSACETAIGTLHDGEGIISLARAFLQSGSRSVITTLWRINEGSSTQVMLDFYAFLKAGKSKSKALQLAKIEQTNNPDFDAHPVFWAAYTPYGQMNSVISSNSGWWYVFGGGLLGLFSFFFFRWRRRFNMQVLI